MIRTMFAAVASLSLLAGAPALAAPCKDAKGKFTKCPPAPAKPVRCKDAKGKFVKCGTPGAKAQATADQCGGFGEAAGAGEAQDLVGRAVGRGSHHRSLGTRFTGCGRAGPP